MFDALAGRPTRAALDDAWGIGLRAMANAHAQAQEAKLTDVGRNGAAGHRAAARGLRRAQEESIAGALREFFDPSAGQVSERLRALVDDQGILARLLDQYVGARNSVLAESLARQVGEQSPLFKKLSPTDSEGLIKPLEAQITPRWPASRELVRALDPLAEDGAVARFLRSLREELKGADEDREKQLSAALAALDANDEGSLLAKLSGEQPQARGGAGRGQPR